MHFCRKESGLSCCVETGRTQVYWASKAMFSCGLKPIQPTGGELGPIPWAADAYKGAPFSAQCQLIFSPRLGFAANAISSRRPLELPRSSRRRIAIDVMGEKEEKGGRAAETDKSPRKSPRLEPQDSSPDRSLSPIPELTDSECPSTPSSDSMDVSDVSSACRHFVANEEQTELVLATAESLKYGPVPACEVCKMLNGYGIGPAHLNPRNQQIFLMCTRCDHCYCGMVNSEGRLLGHIRVHANQNKHWVAVWLDKRRAFYCFICNINLYRHVTGDSDDEDDEVSSFGDGAISLESDLAEVDVSGPISTGERGYVIRGIPNVGFTCYMNSLVQCLLVLDKLRTGMLGPNAPKGSIGTALRELFVATRATNDARMTLNPWNLVESMRALDPKYKGCKMHDSHELLCSLRNWLNEEELNRSPNTQDGTPSAGVTTVVDSIFQGELSTTRTNKCCQYETVEHALFHELSLPLPSRKHPSENIASPKRTRRSQLKGPVVKQLFPVLEESNSEKVQMTADGGDSGIPHTEVETVAMKKLLEPMEVDYSEPMQINQMKNVVGGPLLTHKDVASFPELPLEFFEVLVKSVALPPNSIFNSFPELTQEIIDVPVKSIALLPNSAFSVRVEEIHEPMADSNRQEDTVLPTLRENVRISSSSDVGQLDSADGVYQSNEPETNREGKKNTCSIQIIKDIYIEDKENSSTVQFTKEEKGKDIEKAEGSNFLASIKDCLELFLKEEVIERRCEKCLNVPQQPSTTGSVHGNISVDSVSIEQQYEREHADQKVTISKLPTILTVQLMRFGNDKDDNSKQVKIEGHVSFEENLDVRQFMEPSSEDKDNSSYRLVGIIEHIGGNSLNFGHFVAYVRVSNKVNDGSSSWFCADDAVIRQVSLDEVLKREAFVLFYERMEG